MDDSRGARPVNEGDIDRSPADPRRPRRAIVLLAVLAASLHGVALSGLRWAWPRADAPLAAVWSVPARTMAARVETILPSPPGADLPSSTVPMTIDPPGRPRADSAVARTTRPARPLHAPASTAISRAPPPALPRDPPATVAPAEPSDEEAVPVYRTLIPPGASLRYRVQRGVAVGTGDLSWQTDADGYALSLEGRIDGASVLRQTSRGSFDAAGIAPQRFVEQRARRAAAAVNFQRDAAVITFSGKAAPAALHAGAQDRLSWLLQLASIVAAEPDLRQAGTRVLIRVAGVGGEVVLWAFVCQGPEAGAPGDGGHPPMLAYRREPRGPYDTRAEVWLDPARDYLPRRARWKSGPADDGFDLQWQDGPDTP